jgi:hypothetical protein
MQSRAEWLSFHGVSHDGRGEVSREELSSTLLRLHRHQPVKVTFGCDWGQACCLSSRVASVGRSVACWFFDLVVVVGLPYGFYATMTKKCPLSLARGAPAAVTCLRQPALTSHPSPRPRPLVSETWYISAILEQSEASKHINCLILITRSSKFYPKL